MFSSLIIFSVQIFINSSAIILYLSLKAGNVATTFQLLLAFVINDWGIGSFRSCYVFFTSVDHKTLVELLTPFRIFFFGSSIV